MKKQRKGHEKRMSRSISSQVQYSINQCFCIGTKKREYKTENGQTMSPKIFSFNEKFRLLDVSKNFQNFLKENYPEVHKVVDINCDHVQGFLNSKMDKCTQNTINSYFESLKKIEKVCSYVFKKSINMTSSVIIPKADKSKSNLRGVYNQMPKEVFEKIERNIESMPYSQSGQIILIQKELGVRINEITHLNKSQVDFERKVIYFKNTKGGKRLSRALTPRLERLIKDSIEKKHHETKIFAVENKTVNQYLRRVEDKLKVSRYSFHNIRAMIGQQYYDNLRKMGVDRKDALQLTSEYLNHNTPREQMITKSYLVLR